MLYIMLFITAAGTVTAYLINQAALAVPVVSVPLLFLFVLYTRKRYQDIKKLSGYLRKIYGGDYSLDIRDNMEGELSILKNEIYKVTLILSKQAELLKTEKEQLADALSDISHQLKTPLTSMTVMADLLSNPKLEPEKRKEFTKNIELQLERMEWLLTSLLKLSKIDAGTAQFKNELIEAKKLIRQAVEPLLIPMELKLQNLVIEGKDSAAFTGDFNWSAEAILNIVKNCMEHTPDGGTIRIICDENALYTEIRISDNGSGIDKEDLPYIFKRFYRGKNASKDSVGIGLAMAKSIITSQNGDITAESRVKEGTAFTIKFYKKDF
jgi:signal transduction histidine kinase